MRKLMFLLVLLQSLSAYSQIRNDQPLEINCANGDQRKSIYVRSEIATPSLPLAIRHAHFDIGYGRILTQTAKEVRNESQPVRFQNNNITISIQLNRNIVADFDLANCHDHLRGGGRVTLRESERTHIMNCKCKLGNNSRW